MGASVHLAALRAVRERAGLPQHQLARLVGVAGGERVSRWELGTSEPRPDILARLAKVLKVRAIELLTSKPESTCARTTRPAPPSALVLTTPGWVGAEPDVLGAKSNQSTGSSGLTESASVTTGLR